MAHDYLDREAFTAFGNCWAMERNGACSPITPCSALPGQTRLRYGAIGFSPYSKALPIGEKPQVVKSHYAVTGPYFDDGGVRRHYGQPASLGLRLTPNYGY